MEDWVNCAEMIRKVYGDGVSARSCNDVKWAKVLLGEFLEGRVVLMYSALTNTCSPILKSGAGLCRQSVGP